MSSGSGLRRADTPLEAVATQAQRLWGLTDRRVVWLCLALISVDLFFIAVHSVHYIYASLYLEGREVLHWRWDLEHDRAYSEIFGYAKFLLIIWLLVSIPGKKERPVYLGWAMLFMFALLDDALVMHETLGRDIADALGFGPFAGLRPVDFGELLFWTSAGVILLGLVAVGLAKTTGRDRVNGLLLLGALALLAVFAVGFDMAHIMFQWTFRGSHLLFSVLEDGGEQITLSLICGLAVLIRREVRTRERARRMQ